MQLDRSFMESILSMYDELIENGIYIVYIGKFNQKVTSMFSAMLDEELSKNSIEDKKTRRRVYHAMIETMQNIQRHAASYSENAYSNGLFMIGKKEGVYYIITTNKISTLDKTGVVKAIEKVNSCTKEELDEMYKTQLRDGKIGEHGGAGLGLIDIARKTQNKIEYLFLPIDLYEDYFIFKTELDPLKFRQNTNNQ